MGRPRLIILIRHAQSEGNKNREIHQSIPDHRVKLTQEGWQQARDAGRRLRAMLRPEDTLQFYTSPYRRTRETTEGILETLTSDDPDPSPFKRRNMKVYEEPRLREQDFGNFQPCSAEMERMWQERADYGHFFYRIPNGESAADAYDRVSGFNESLWRQFGEDDFPSVCVLVTHGLMSRVFLMKWYHFSVEYFEDLRNVNHCEFLIMKKQQDSGRYDLENKLRTWSELRREREALKAKEDKELTDTGKKKELSKIERQNSTPIAPRRWGGCPHGCDHGKDFKIRRDLAELRQHDEDNATNGVAHAVPETNGTIASRRTPAKRVQGPNNSDDDSDDPRGRVAPHIDVTKAQEEVVSSPDGTPSYITIEDRLRNALKTPQKSTFLHTGRDFGGTLSGHASEEEFSENDARERLAAKVARVRNGERSLLNGRDPSATRHAHANKLGDAPNNSDQGSDGGDEAEDIDKAEREDKSIRGSVY
ncbi:phosphoglycerate mutase-like protein [Annulohypoxylon truncatum]|uniref:phosphoglycerate mutase-like protein n=1 Tax=Annulohypoxylon truncatum TaxID=327061 RepID=UPI0020084C16|nr:phosphoglycerate mutase-like protein [Annulohypoxylon truncatum]KAI1210388.1 phosphoglycerate mutase-like protein [Annulohypoxylon truncatum]